MPRKYGKTVTDIRSLARSHTGMCVNTLAGIARSPKAADSARVAAATELLNRGWGKAPNVLQGDEDGGAIKLEYDVRELARRVWALMESGAKDVEFTEVKSITQST